MQKEYISLQKGVGELREKRSSTAKGVGHKAQDKTLLGIEGPKSQKRTLDRGWMVAVVIQDDDTPGLPHALGSTSCSTKLGECLTEPANKLRSRRLSATHPRIELLNHKHGSCGVQSVVHSGYP